MCQSQSPIPPTSPLFPLWYHTFKLPQGLIGKQSICNAGDTGAVGSIPGLEEPLEETMATPSSIIAWRNP